MTDQQLPADIPSNFVIPDLSGLDTSRHDSIAPTLIRVNAAFIALVASILAIRLYTRLFIVRRIGIDDYLMLLAGASIIAVSIIAILGTKNGLGKHVWDIPFTTVLHDTKVVIKYLFVCQIMYATGLTLTKFSIMASYLRIFPNDTFRRLIFVTGAVVLAIWVCALFVTIFQCNPVRGAWDFTTESQCIEILKFFYVTAGFNIATDLLLCVLPLPQFWRLNLALKERVIVCVLFGFGLFATVASVLRLTQLHNLGAIDVTYSSVNSLNWSVVEVGTGILCASVPSIKPLITRILPGRVFSTVRSLGGVGGGGGGGFSRSRKSKNPSAISGPYDLKHLSGAGIGDGSIGMDSRHSRMSFAKTGTVMTRVYSPGRGGDRDDGGREDGEDDSFGSAVDEGEFGLGNGHGDGNGHGSGGARHHMRRLSQVMVTHNIEVVR